MSVLGSQELVDSSCLLGDREALRARMAEEGYVFFRSLLDPAEIRSVGASVLFQLQAAGWTEAGCDPVMARPVLPVRAVRMADLFGDRTYTRIVLNPRLNQVAYRSRLADMMRDLLGPIGFCYPLRIPRIVYPTCLAPRQPGNYVHKDYRSVQDMFTCWTPFGEIPRGLGGLALLPGSQTTDRVTPHPIGRLPTGWLTTDYEPGDVLVFHCLTSHAALPNLSDRMRFSVEYRWQLADQPAPRRLVIGPAGVEIGSRFLRRYAWWKPMPAGLQLFDEDLDDTQSRLPAPPSRFVRFP
jgi:Phytanoyl-CoA dioxygenase (PhyH)